MNNKIKQMTPLQIDLYQKICNFKLDNPQAIYSFSDKLAWEYQWTKIYTYRVIKEYKKFIFLAMIAKHIVSPSTDVDRVWHLHLLYTHSYQKIMGVKPMSFNTNIFGGAFQATSAKLPLPFAPCPLPF